MPKKTKLSELAIERSLPIVAMPLTYARNTDTPSVQKADYTYEILSPDTGLAVAIHMSFDLLSKISAANGLLLYGLENPRLPDVPSSTWPQQWKYLTQEQLDQLEQSGLPVKSHSYILTESLQIASFPQTLYFPKEISTFFDSWIEIIWQEYVIETELRRFQELQKKGQPNAIVINQPNEINLQNADTWIPLENCVVRIRSIWERIHKTIVPIYFTGNEAPESAANYWKDLDIQIGKMLNQNQLPYYELLRQAVLETIQASSLKSMRDALIHKLSHRPIGVVPASIPSTSSLPKTVDELHELVLTERSRYREALVLITAIMRAKTPPNNEVTGTVS